MIFTPDTKPTGWVSMTNDAYHADKSAISSTSLKDYRKCPATFLRKWLGEQKKKDSSAMNFGSVFHSAILEPDLYYSQFAVMPKFSGVGMKKAKEEWLSQHTGKMVLTADEYDDHRFMIDSVLDNTYASALLKSGFAERSGFFKDEATGIPGKIRLDFYSDEYDSIVDIKTTRDAGEHAFARSIGNFGYHISAAWYLRGFEAIEKRPADSFSFIAIEKTDRYRCFVYQLDTDDLRAAENSINLALDRLKKSIETESFPKFTLPPSVIKRPEWQAKEDSIYDY